MAGEGRTQAQCREALPEIVLAAAPASSSWRAFLITQPDRRRGFRFDAPSLRVAGSKTAVDCGPLEGLVAQASLNWPGAPLHGAFVAN